MAGTSRPRCLTITLLLASVAGLELPLLGHSPSAASSARVPGALRAVQLSSAMFGTVATAAPAIAAEASLCAADAPCDFDAARFLTDLVASPGGICILAYAAFRAVLAVSLSDAER